MSPGLSGGVRGVSGVFCCTAKSYMFITATTYTTYYIQKCKHYALTWGIFTFYNPNVVWPLESTPPEEISFFSHTFGWESGELLLTPKTICIFCQEMAS